MADKRIYELTTTADIVDKYLALDKSGNAEAEKILVSDIGGGLTFKNALKEAAGEVTWGGALDRDTTINGGQSWFVRLNETSEFLAQANDGSSTSEMYLYNDGSLGMYAYEAGDDTEFYMDYFSGELYLEVYDNASGDDAALYMNAVGTEIQLYTGGVQLTMSNSGNEFRDDANLKGLEYNADYSANFTARSIVDKAYVDAGGGTTYTFSGGLNEFPPGTVYWGGTLNAGGTQIDGAGGTRPLQITDLSQLTLGVGASSSIWPRRYIDIDPFKVLIRNNFSSSNFMDIELSNTTIEIAARYGGSVKSILFDPGIFLVTDTDDNKGLEYAADYSGAFTARSLVDKAYADSIIGGVSWSGSTANGIGTYLTSTTIQSEPNLTFNGTLLDLTGTIDSRATGVNTFNLASGDTDEDVILKFIQVTTTKGLIGFDDGENALSMQYGTAFSDFGNFRLSLGGAVAGFYGTTSAQLIVRAQTGGVQLWMSPNTGSDAAIFWQDGFGSTEFIEGHDSSQSLFQIHSGSSFTTPELADFSITTIGRVYMGSLLNATNTNTMRYNLTTGQLTFFSSDISLKDEIKPFEVDALETLKGFDPKVWKWKEDGTSGTGWIAQEGVTSIPAMFPKSGKTDLYGISEYEILPYFHKAIQQLQGKIEELEDKLKFINT